MKRRTPAALFVLCLTAVAFAAEPPKDVVFIDHAKVTSMFAKGGGFEANSEYKVMAGHREGPGNVEIHDYDTDVFYIVDGTATLVTGGTAVDAQETGPGEKRAPRTTGGTSHRLTKGDFIVIPPGIPHWTTAASKPFDYFVVKIVGPKSKPAADDAPKDVVLIDHTKAAAVFAKGGMLEANSQFKILAGHREGPGEVEVHDADTDIFYIIDGHATFVTGGQGVDLKRTAPGEWRGPKTTGGTPHRLTAADILFVPAGVPHWFTDTSKPFTYLVIKVTDPAKPLR